MGNNLARYNSTSPPSHKRVLLGSVCVLALALALGCSPATAKDRDEHKSKSKDAEHSKEPFGNLPKGPLQIFISINQQKVHLYSDGTHVADALVATGVPGHATPMGLFSVIEKDRYHHSNIYSGAPMPYMQRITWSGVAMHEGPGVGHVASHGCIRMPHEFVSRLWLITKLGVRVVIARPELKPTDFADSHLFVHKEPPPPAPTAAIPADAVKTAQTIDSSTKTDAVDSPLPAAQTPDSDLIKAAKAVALGVATGLDAAEPAKAADAATDSVGAIASEPGKHVSASTDVPKPAAPQTIGANAPAAPTTAQPGEPVKSTAADTPTVKPVEPETDAAASAGAEPEAVPMPLPKPDRLVKAAAEKGAPIAIFVSRRLGKIYVRQNFAPVFSAKVAIAHPEQPMGTHLFTAMEYKDDNSTFRWNVVTLPPEQPKARHSDDDDDDSRAARRAREKRKAEAEAAAAATPPVQTPAEALARIDIPQDVIEQISEMIVPGSSLIVSDQGLGEETGEYTDFIVVTR